MHLTEMQAGTEAERLPQPHYSRFPRFQGSAIGKRIETALLADNANVLPLASSISQHFPYLRGRQDGA